MQKNGHEDHPAQPVGNNKARCDRDAVKKSMDDQPHEHRVPSVSMHESIFVSFFAEMEVGSDRVLEQMNQQITSQYEDRSALASKLQARWEDLYNRGRQHESRTQRHEIFQIGTVPVFLDNDGAAENIGGRRSKPQ